MGFLHLYILIKENVHDDTSRFFNTIPSLKKMSMPIHFLFFFSTDCTTSRLVIKRDSTNPSTRFFYDFNRLQIILGCSWDNKIC